MTKAKRILLRTTLGAMVLVSVSACGMMIRMATVKRPADDQFGLGPRTSAHGIYVASIETAAPLRTGRLQQIKLELNDAAQQDVEGATIEVDGGMPQHGHGLPTAPRVTRSLGHGVYQVDGLKFNMGGWWELKFRIRTAAGVDSVTFNIEL